MRREMFCPACQINGYIELAANPRCPVCNTKLTGPNRSFPQTFLPTWQDPVMTTSPQELTELAALARLRLTQDNVTKRGTKQMTYNNKRKTD